MAWVKKMNIEQSDIQLAALRSSNFLSSKIKVALPTTTQFDFFGFSHIIEDIRCVDEKEFFQNLEDRTTQFFMEWFGADSPAEISVRRRIALQSIKDIANTQFWNNIETLPDLPRKLSAVENAFGRYEKEMERANKSTARSVMFGGLQILSKNFWDEYNLLKQAKGKNGVVSCEKDLLVDLVAHQLTVVLTQRFNQILKSLNINHSFQTSTPQLSKQLLEVRLFKQRSENHQILPPQMPIQVSY